MSNEPTDDKPSPSPAATDDAGDGSYGWLTALRAKLGLPSAPTFRATLENTLKNASEGEAFSRRARDDPAHPPVATRLEVSWCRAQTSLRDDPSRSNPD